MKKNVTATLLALALLCALTTGCGSRDDQGGNAGGNTSVMTPGENNGGSGGNGGGSGSSGSSGSSIMDDVEQGMEDAGNALTGNGGGSGSGSGSGSGAQSGVPYDELLDDGRVHDTDGNLNDGENSSSAKSR